MRLAEVWLDEYKALYYDRIQNQLVETTLCPAIKLKQFEQFVVLLLLLTTNRDNVGLNVLGSYVE